MWASSVYSRILRCAMTSIMSGVMIGDTAASLKDPSLRRSTPAPVVAAAAMTACVQLSKRCSAASCGAVAFAAR
jgi:hypothetical protein